jgi:hypothetical protein
MGHSTGQIFRILIYRRFKVRNEESLSLGEAYPQSRLIDSAQVDFAMGQLASLGFVPSRKRWKAWTRCPPGSQNLNSRKCDWFNRRCAPIVVGDHRPLWKNYRSPF